MPDVFSDIVVEASNVGESTELVTTDVLRVEEESGTDAELGDAELADSDSLDWPGLPVQPSSGKTTSYA